MLNDCATGDIFNFNLVLNPWFKKNDIGIFLYIFYTFPHAGLPRSMPINADQNYGINPNVDQFRSMSLNADQFRSIPLNAYQCQIKQN